MIDLRSDTATRPTAGMRAAIAAAEVGDEQKREDPTVTALQERVAALLGHEAALFLPTATMANQIALKLHSRPGDVLIAERHAHVVIYEYGGAAAHAGLMIEAAPGSRRADHAGPADRGARIRARRRPTRCRRCSRWRTRTTARVAGAGRSTSSRHVVDTAHALGLAVHLDGARLFNAAVAQGVEPAAIAARFDTVTVCLSKGSAARSVRCWPDRAARGAGLA